MRYLFALSAGFLAGIALVAAVVYYNPAAATNDAVQTRSMSGNTLQLSYGSQSADALMYVNSSDGYWPRVPTDTKAFWQPTLDGAHVAVHALSNRRGEIVGLGVKFFQVSESSRLLRGDVLVDSVWNVVLPSAGSFFIEQQEDYWPFVREVGLPAWLAGDKRWQGRFRSELTVGPRGTLEGVLLGARGVFAGREGEVRESISVNRYGLGASHDSSELDVERSLLVTARESRPVADVAAAGNLE